MKMDLQWGVPGPLLGSANDDSYQKYKINVVTFIKTFNKKLEDISPFLYGHWYPCFGLMGTSPMGFKARFCNLIAIGGGIYI